MEAFLGWSNGELPDFPNLDPFIFDSVLAAPESLQTPTSHMFPAVHESVDEVQGIEEIPELVSDDQSSTPSSTPPAAPFEAQEELAALKELVNELTSRVEKLESQKFEGLERYIEQLELYLVHFSSSVQEAVADDDIDD
ncbi:hypothetical protein BDV39DRAFT_193200 [Aspergillus sergii]|uniref:Uncharacterized protein n=1 Tax=Aspergillus sergii TaxID=1034303 RepID=A0A5N6X400_9EURO|nr:hypothetical protein BDV39DRAFT_193200 [Aspergillus sergii]